MVSRNIFATEAEIQSLPTTGTEWARVQTISGADPGTGNLDLINATHGPSLIVMALRWRRDGGGLGKQRVIDEAFQGLSTYTTATSQPLNPYRQIGAYVRALDLVDCPMTTVVPDVGITYGALLDRLVTFDFPGNTRWSNMRECTKDSGSNWGSMARDAFTSIALVRGNATWIDECLRSHKRMLGDLTIPNDGAGTNPRFTSQSSISQGWFPPGLTYPTNTGSINPAVSNLDLAGANAVEASRGTAAPPLSAAGLGYTMESWEGMLATSLMWLHAGYPDALGWGNNAVRRNAANFDRYGGWTDPASTQASRSFLAHLCNYLYATSYNEVAVTGGQGGRRLLPDVSPWLVLGTWSKTASTPGGPTTPVVVNPTVTATVALAAQARTVDAQATVTAGSAAVTSVRFAWGDGTPDTVDTAAPFAAVHTYATSGAKRVTMTATAADGGTATVARDVTVPVAGDTSPVVAFAATTATRGRSPHTVTFSLAGTVSVNGTALTASVAWGDGTTLASAPLTGTFSHTYTGTTFPAAFVAVATITQASTSQVVQRSVAVTVDAPIELAEYLSLGGYKTADGEILPVRVTADTGGLDVVTGGELASALNGVPTAGQVTAAAQTAAEAKAGLLDRWTKDQSAVVHAPFEHDELHYDQFFTKAEAAARFAPISAVAGQGFIGIDTDGVPYIIAPTAPAPLPPTPPATNTVTATLRDWLGTWRLQLPTDVDENGVIDEVRIPELSTYASQFFSETQVRDGFQFWVPGNGASSTNSAYARSELRETNASGGNAAWDIRDGRRHTLRIPPGSVDSITGSKRRLILAQIHNGDDVVTLRLDNNTTGGLQLAYLYGDGLAPDPAPLVVVANYTLGTVHAGGELVAENGTIKCYWAGALVATFTDTWNRGAAYYFKVGAYFLSEPGLTSYVRAPQGTTVTMAAEPSDISARVRMLGNPLVTHVTVAQNEPTTPGGSTGPGVGPYATLSRFKLQLPINSDNAGNVDEIPRDQLVAGYTSQWFRPTTDGRGFRLTTPVTGARTSGSSFPRTELREMNADGVTTAGWHPSDGRTRTFAGVYRVNHLPAQDAQVTLFQLHNEDTEVVTVRCDVGTIRVRKNGSSLTPFPIPTYAYGTDFTVNVRVTGGTAAAVRVQINGATAHEFPLADLTPGPRNLFYFKAGNYLQASPTTVTDPAEYGEVELRDIVATF